MDAARCVSSSASNNLNTLWPETSNHSPFSPHPIHARSQGFYPRENS
jgi:hypothetical protein